MVSSFGCSMGIEKGPPRISCKTPMSGEKITYIRVAMAAMSRLHGDDSKCREASDATFEGIGEGQKHRIMGIQRLRSVIRPDKVGSNLNGSSDTVLGLQVGQRNRFVSFQRRIVACQNACPGPLCCHGW